MQIFTLLLLILLNNLLKDNSYCSCVKTFRLGVNTSRIFVFELFLGGYFVLAPTLDFCLVNTISNACASLYDPLHAIVLCYHP